MSQQFHQRVIYPLNFSTGFHLNQCLPKEVKWSNISQKTSKMRIPKMNTHLCGVFVLPEGVRVGFHSIFGQAVSSTNERQSAQNTGHIYHPALALFQQWQKLEGHINNPNQIHIQNLCEILQLHPLGWTDGYGPASIIHQTPQTCRGKEAE